MSFACCVGTLNLRGGEENGARSWAKRGAWRLSSLTLLYGKDWRRAGFGFYCGLWALIAKCSCLLSLDSHTNWTQMPLVSLSLSCSLPLCNLLVASVSSVCGSGPSGSWSRLQRYLSHPRICNSLLLFILCVQQFGIVSVCRCSTLCFMILLFPPLIESLLLNFNNMNFTNFLFFPLFSQLYLFLCKLNTQNYRC